MPKRVRTARSFARSPSHKRSRRGTPKPRENGQTLGRRGDREPENLLTLSELVLQDGPSLLQEQKARFIPSSQRGTAAEQEAWRKRIASLFTLNLLWNAMNDPTREQLRYTHDIDVARFDADRGKRVNFTHGGDAHGEVDASFVRRAIESMHCTLRLRRPQEISDPLYVCLAGLEEDTNAAWGANVYATPPGAAQGFAPHYDDIDAFVVQLQGRKAWRVYDNSEDHDLSCRLPRFSSRDFHPSESKRWRCVFDGELKPGDCLYIPRGFPHHAHTLEGMDADISVHVTLSTGYQVSWADILRDALLDAIDCAALRNVELRRNLPISTSRSDVQEVMDLVMPWVTLDRLRGSLSRRVLRERLPPAALVDSPKQANGERVGDKCLIRATGRQTAAILWLPSTEPGQQAAPEEAGSGAEQREPEECPWLFHCCRNSRSGLEPSEPVALSLAEARSLAFIIDKFPKPVEVGQLKRFFESHEDRIDLVAELLELGVVLLVSSETA